MSEPHEVDPLRLVEDVAIRYHRVAAPTRPFAAVLGPEDRTAIVCDPVAGQGPGSQRPDWEMTFGPTSDEPLAVDVRLLGAVRALSASITAVAWVRPAADGRGVEIRSEDRSGRARRTWSTDPRTNAWDREDATPALWTASDS